MAKRLWIGKEGGVQLAAELHRAQGGGRSPVVGIAHGWGSSKASPRGRALAAALVEAGIAALLFDFRGHGESEGELEQLSLQDQEDDLRAVLDWAEANPALGAIGVAGSSSGAAVALAVAAGDPRVKALVLRAPSAAALPALAARVAAPALVLIGEQDPLFERGRALASSLGGEHRLCAVPGAGHLFEEPGAFERAARETVSWFRRHLPGAQEPGEDARERAVQTRIAAGPGRFHDRAAAGRLLARELEPYRALAPLILALPRGGIEVAAPVAEALGAELDVLVARKIRAPEQPELAIGAVAEGGVVLWNESLARALAPHAEQRAQALAQAQQELEERSASYRRAVPRLPLAGRALVVVDDGVATGATLKAALQAIAAAGPARLAVALPGGARETLEDIAALAGVDEVVVLAVPEPFWAVGQLYERFAQVSSERVCELLRAARRRGCEPSGPTR